MENNNQISTITMDNGYIAQLVGESRTVSYSTIDTANADFEARAALFNVINGDCPRIKEKVNVPLCIQHMYAEEVTIADEKTGEARVCPRIVLIDIDGNGYQSVSNGIFGAMKKLIEVVGPMPWTNGVWLTPYIIDKGTNKQITSLRITPKDERPAKKVKA